MNPSQKHLETQDPYMVVAPRLLTVVGVVVAVVVVAAVAVVMGLNP